VEVPLVEQAVKKATADGHSYVSVDNHASSISVKERANLVIAHIYMTKTNTIQCIMPTKTYHPNIYVCYASISYPHVYVQACHIAARDLIRTPANAYLLVIAQQLLHTQSKPSMLLLTTRLSHQEACRVVSFNADGDLAVYTA
jgi:hypothetical protein